MLEELKTVISPSKYADFHEAINMGIEALQQLEEMEDDGK